MATKIPIERASEVTKNLRKEIQRSTAMTVSLAADALQARVQADLPKRFNVKTPFTAKSIKAYKPNIGSTKPTAIVRTRADYLGQTETGEDQKPVKGKDVPIATLAAANAGSGLAERKKRIVPKYKTSKLGDIADALQPANPSKTKANNQSLMMQVRLAQASGKSKAAVIWDSGKGRALYEVSGIKSQMITPTDAPERRLRDLKSGKRRSSGRTYAHKQARVKRVRKRMRKVMTFRLKMLYDLTKHVVPRKKNPFMRLNTETMMAKDMPKITREMVAKAVEDALKAAKK